jgi:energy-coupling factor transport system ATP-binding protein
METKEVARAVILVAIAVALSPFFIPVGISKCFAYAVAIATIAGIIRNILGLGTLLAFPGGMIGALLAGLAYRASKNIYLAGLGEVIGTGILGSLVSVWIVAPLLMGKAMALATLMIAFSVGGIWEP